MSTLRQRMMGNMHLPGYAAKSQEACVESVRSLAKYYERNPAEITQEAVQAYSSRALPPKHAYPSGYFIMSLKEHVD